MPPANKTNRISLPPNQNLQVKFDQTTPNAMTKQMLATNRFHRKVVHGSARKPTQEYVNQSLPIEVPRISRSKAAMRATTNLTNLERQASLSGSSGSIQLVATQKPNDGVQIEPTYRSYRHN